MSKSRSISRISSSPHEAQPAQPAEQLGDRMHLERSMVAQLGNVPRVEQLGSSGSAGSGGEPAGVGGLGVLAVGLGGVTSGQNLAGEQGEQAVGAVGASSVVVRLSSPSPQAMDAAVFDLSDSPPKDRSVRRRTTPSPKPGGIRLHSPMVKTARSSARRPSSVVSDEPRRGRRSPSRRACFGPGTAVHQHLPMDPAASDIANLNIMVQQQVFDRQHMATLKQAIERLHEASETQRLATEAAEQKFQEQAAVNLRMFKENAELRGACTQHAVRMDTRFNGIVESIKGQDMVDLVETVAADMIEIKIEAAFKTLSADVDRMKEII